MKVFVDTSAILALLDKKDHQTLTAWDIWHYLAETKAELATTNYVIVESSALLQSRLGLEAVRDFQKLFVPLLDPTWVDESLHNLGMGFMLAANRRKLSLVDCVSFAAMREMSIEHYFAFDEHFAEQGFTRVNV